MHRSRDTQPHPLSDTVSAQMSRMPTRNSSPEVAVRRVLHAHGLRFRVNHPELPGKPDIALTRARIAVFIDGCFWHACPEHGTLPKNNREWWRAKLAGNLERDRRKDAELERLGYMVLHFWEHEDPDTVAKEVISYWSQRLGSPPRV